MRDILAGLDTEEKKEPRDILAGLDEEPIEMEAKQEIPEGEVSEELPEENKYGEVGHQKTAGMTHIPESYKDVMDPGVMSDFRNSLMSGAGQDAIKLNNFLATHPITNALFAPMKELDLGETPMPGVAKTTAAILPWMATGAVGTGLKAIKGTVAAAKMMGKLPSLAKGLENVARTHPIMTKAGKLFGTGAAEMGAIEKIFGEHGDDASKLGTAALAGGIINLSAHGALSAVPHGVKTVTNLFKKIGDTTPEAAQSVVDLFKDAPHVLNLPDVIRMPKLSSFYHNVLKWIPGSGVAKEEKAMITHMERSGASTMNDLLGKAGEKMEPVDTVKMREGISKEIVDLTNKKREEAGKLYSNLYNSAEKSKFKFIPEKVSDFSIDLAKLAKGEGKTIKERYGSGFSKVLDDLKSTPEELIVGGQRITDPKKIEKFLKTFPEEERPTPMSAERFKEIKTLVSDKIETLKGKPAARKWKQLKSVMSDDFTSSVEKTGNKNLIELDKKATDFYREEVVPLTKKRSMVKLANTADLDTKSDFVEKTLTNPKNKRVLKMLSSEIKNKLSYLKLDKGIKDNGEAVVPRVIKAFKDLTEYDKDHVLTASARKKFEELSKKYEIAKPSYKSMSDNVMRGIHEVTRSRHIAKGVAVGAGVYGAAHVTGLVPLAGVGALVGRALGSKGLLEAYTKGIIPGEKIAPEIAKRIAKAAKMGISLAELSNTE